MQWFRRTLGAMRIANNRGVSATGKQTGGFHLYAHRGGSKTFMGNRRRELKARVRRKQKLGRSR